MNGYGALLIGVGDIGSKLTNAIINEVSCDHIFINKNNKKEIYNNIIISTNSYLSPSINKIREAFYSKKNEILEKCKNYNSVVIIGNLASNFGLAIIPVLSQLLKLNGQKETICIVIMPFSFEKEKFFRCGTSLSFLNKFADSIIMVDNDVFLRNETEMTLQECFEITNKSIQEIVTFLLTNYFPNKFNFLVTNDYKPNLTNSFSSAMAILTKKLNIENINKTYIYLHATTEKISQINDIIETSKNILGHSEHKIQWISDTMDLKKLHILAGTNQDISSLYDPLNYIIPEENVLDFTPEFSISDDLLYHLKDLESLIPFKN